MGTEVKIRNLDEATLERLRVRAVDEGRSLESLLRSILTDAVVDEVTSEDWKAAGFEQVDEVAPGRLYEAWADGVCYRIAITRPILRGSSIAWNSSIDQLCAGDPFDSDEETRRVWFRPTGIPSRLLGDTPEMALRDAMRWLGNWAGFDAMGRARRDAESAEQMEPALRKIVDAIDVIFAHDAKATWRDETRASWSTDDLDFFVSRSLDEVVLMTYLVGTPTHAFAPERFPLVSDVAERIAQAMRHRMEGKGEPVRRLHGKRPV